MSAIVTVVVALTVLIAGLAIGAKWAAGVAAALIFGFLLIGGFVFRNQSEVLVINAYRADRPSFFKRTRDDWIVEVIVMLMGLLLGFIIGHLTK
jgi:hypothetical protein